MKKNCTTSGSNGEKAEVERYCQKIRQKIESGPEWAKKAAAILVGMLEEKKGSQK